MFRTSKKSEGGLLPREKPWARRCEQWTGGATLLASMNWRCNSFNNEQLHQLEKFLEFEDEIIYNFYNFDKVNKEIDKNKISEIFKNFKIWWRRGWDSNPRTSCPVAGFQDQCFQPLSHLSLSTSIIYYYQSKEITMIKY